MKWNKALLIVVLTAGMCSQASILVRDEFDTAASADAANGIYAQDAGVGATGPVGGSITGFDVSRAWSATSSFLRTHDSDLLCLVGYTAERIGTRQLSAGTMSGITKACGQVEFNFTVPEGYGQGSSKIGFTTEAALSSVGATIRINWDSTNSEWDLDAIYNNGSIAVGKVMDGISLNTDYSVTWEMDEVAGTLKVWVNAGSADDAPTATFTDYAGSVQGIDDLYVQYVGLDDVAGASTTERDGLRYRSVVLADSLESLFVSEPVSDLVAYDEFVTGSAADAANGMYESGADLSSAANSGVVGGTIAGFDSAHGWAGSGYYEAYAQMVRLVGRSDSSAAWLNRTLAGSLTGEAEAFASLVLRVADHAEAGGQVLAGFSTETMSSPVGSAVGYSWNGSGWDMVLRYRNASGVVLATIRENITPNEFNAFYWSMNAETDTIQVWVNETNTNARADLTVTDWEGDVETITDFVASLHQTGVGNTAYLDTIQLGRTAEAIGMAAVPSSGFMFILAEAPDTDLYVAPVAQGNGYGLNAENAAAYTDEAFWSRVQSTLASEAVTVTLQDGSYADGLAFNSFGDANHVFTLTGESPDGVLFNGTGSSVQFDLAGCRNMIVENLNFTGDGAGYALRITAAGSLVSSNITVRNCDWYDMEKIVYGASGVQNGSHHVTYENCRFERIGKDRGSHMMYHAYNADHVSVVNCHFEDCSGSYVRFRAGSDYGTVSNCTFVSTQTYANRSTSDEVFVEFPVFNDVNPGDETVSLYGTVVDNSFSFSSGSPAIRAGIQYYLKGYDPTGWSYLMTAAEGAVLEGSDSTAKKALLLSECGLDFDQVTISGNSWNNETGRILFASYAAYGAESQGWDGTADISDIVY